LGALWGEERDSGAAGAGFKDAADWGDGNAGYSTGDAGCVWGGEEEFVVFSAVEGLGNGCGRVDGEGCGLDLGGYTGLFAEVGEIGGEAVTEVDGGGGQAVADEPEALGDAGLGVEVRSKLHFELLWDAGRLLVGRRGFGKLREAGEGGCGSA
jgi:hypothetical protein